METESFEDPEVAQILNDNFVSIKVDREERPDIDHIYMNVCQALTGQGGWPLTIVMTPDQKPFFAGTYFPKNKRMGMPGLMNILGQINDTWVENKEDLVESAQKITSAINTPARKTNISQVKSSKLQGAFNKNSPDTDIDMTLINSAFQSLKRDFDNVYGGFGNAPKFPSPHNIYFLLRYYYKTKDSSALEIVEKTLDSIYRGGIYDHIGYGFSRYSTDRKWLVPHFEKMLYDNSLLSIAYLETYQLTQKTIYAEIAEQIFTYVLRDMTSEDYGFYSAEDADSEGVEGKFYLWTPDEVKQILGNDYGEKFCKYYNITSGGNFEGKNIANLINSTIEPDDIQLIKTCKEKLHAVRDKRIHPHKDDKILTGWNGLMAAAFAIGGKILNKQEYISVAEKNIKFVYSKLIRSDGRLLARYRDGHSSFLAYAEDYSYLIWALIELYESSYNSDYLTKALNLSSDLCKYFLDKEDGGLFVYGSDSEKLITRPKEIYDGAVPSANSVSALNFLRLAQLTENNELESTAHNMLQTFMDDIKDYPKGYTFLLTALLYSQTPSKKVVIAGSKNDQNTKNMLNLLQQNFYPFTVALFSETGQKSLSSLENYKTVDGKATAYVCENYTCKPPVTELEEFKKFMV